MDNQDETLHGFEDEYLDDVIRLAVKRERMQEAEEILRLSREPVTPEEESRLDRIWAQALTRMDEIESRKKKAGRVRTLRSAIVNFSRIAACLAVLIVIGAGFAVATNSTFRSAVYRLFITEDAGNNLVSITYGKDPNAAFNVPEGWLGTYFPSSIPAYFSSEPEIFEDPDMPTIEYTAEDGRYFYFNEAGVPEEASVSEGAFRTSDDSIIRKVMINGREVHIIETQNPLSFDANWTTDDRWLTLITQNMSWEETQSLIESVRKIIREEN